MGLSGDSKLGGKGDKKERKKRKKGKKKRKLRHSQRRRLLSAVVPAEKKITTQEIHAGPYSLENLQYIIVTKKATPFT